MNELWGDGTVKLEIKDESRNMESVIKDHFYLVENAKQACMKAGVTPVICPIRGGTDGCKLSFKGLPCPNLGTGDMVTMDRWSILLSKEWKRW